MFKPYGIKDSPFYKLRTKKKLAKLLRVSESALKEILKRDDLYQRRWKPKKGNGKWLTKMPASSTKDNFRPIDISDGLLKSMQSRIAELLGKIAVPDYLFNPVKGRSNIDNAAHHVGYKTCWFLDIENYFPNCLNKKIAHLFLKKFECSKDVTAILVHIVTVLDEKTDKRGLPQGSPCSPILAFFSHLDMWEEIASIVKSAGLRFSVYADDITISSGDKIYGKTIWEIKKVIHKHGLKIAREKEQSLIKSPARITGVIVKGNELTVPNCQKQKLRAKKLELKKLNKKGNAEAIKKLEQSIDGLESYSKQVGQFKMQH